MKKAILVAAVITMFGCAQQVAPTGGPKDEKPPEILSEEPTNLTTDFMADEIIISFDEFIQFKNASEQVIISPPMLKSPTYQLKKKSLVVRFEEELAENTTYTINFGEAIRDNNEGNVLKNYTYVFSTGSHLDSMQVRGKLTDAFTGGALEDVLVMLYKENVDSLPVDTIPNYFTRSGSDGSYHIQHVADQPYKIFALKDENSNYRFDVPEEQVGFLDSLITPFTPTVPSIPDSSSVDSINGKVESTPIPSYDMKLFVEEDTTQFLKKSYCDHFGKLVFVYNRPVGKLNVELDGSSFKSQWALKDYSEERDTIALWTTGIVPDTMSLLLSTGKSTVDTVELVMKPRTDEVESSSQSKGKGKKKQLERFALSAKSNPSKSRSPKPGKALSIIWNHPIVGTDLSKLKLYEDSVRVKYDIVSTDTALRKFDLIFNWKKESRYQVMILDSAFTDIYGLWNDTVDFSFVGIDKKSFGELSLNISAEPKHQIVVELLGLGGRLIGSKATRESGIVKFEGLDPGKYSIRVTKDLNRNGRWDSGRYSLKLQPEPINIIESEAEIRPNWELELEWDPNE